MSQLYSLMIHGGAGALQHIQKESDEASFESSVIGILEQGRHALEEGGHALDIAELCAALLEDDPLYNAGRGSVLNEYGEVEMDAAIMNGIDLDAGAVANVKGIKNPISLARQVLNRSEHVMLAGYGAIEFAAHCDIQPCPDDYFITEARVKQLEAAKQSHGMFLDHEDNPQPTGKLGTIGVVVRDQNGNLAAATSTGGIVNKRWGRVGDTPIIGAGVYADNETCAVSATGYGEQFMRTVLAKTIADFMYFQELDAQAAAQAGIDYLVNKVNGLGGVIVVDHQGRCAAARSTTGMIHGWIEQGGEAQFRWA